MYASDSFFTLTQFGRIGLAALSFLLALSMLTATRRFTRPLGIARALGVTLTLFILFVWLSPQVY